MKKIESFHPTSCAHSFIVALSPIFDSPKKKTQFQYNETTVMAREKKIQIQIQIQIQVIHGRASSSQMACP
jgi:hypothetical protein